MVELGIQIMGLAGNDVKSDVVETLNQTCGIDHVSQDCRTKTPGTHIQNLKHTAAVSKINISRSKVQIIFTVPGIEGELLWGLCKNFIKPLSGKIDSICLGIDSGSGSLEHL